METILIIEDSPNVRRLIEVSLRRLNATILTAADGVSGLETALRIVPSVIVLDIGLPGMNGWEVLDRLRANHSTTNTKVLILTAHSEPELAVHAQEGHADVFMTKPFDPTDLRQRIAELIGAQTTVLAT